MEALRQITAALLLCLLAAGPASAADAASTEAPQEVALKRVNLLVSDLDRSLALYSGILGFRVSGISESSPQSYSYAVFQLPAEARLRFATLDSSTESRALALTEVKGVALPDARTVPFGAAVIRVTELDGRLTQLKAAGLRIVEPRRSKTPEGRAFTEAAFTDPDGHVVVLYELD
jgi:catechol 2,3-dioxygenase-like lactoylglutathione lyase family enzyme